MYRLFLLLLYFLPYTLQAQNNYNNHWFFGWGHGVHFTNGYIENSLKNSANISYTTALSDIDSGSLLYYCSIIQNTNNRNITNNILIDSTNTYMVNSSATYGIYELRNNIPLIIPYPNNSHLYILITSFGEGLQYSVIDMTLNRGRGDMVTNYRFKELMPYRSVLPYKITFINSCYGYWLVVRSSIDNGFYSFKIDANGVDVTPIISNVGTFPLHDYLKIGPAICRLRSNENGTLLVETSINGVELYDIEPCSGIIKNPRIIDTTTSFGVCFSPDSKVLYTARAEYQTGYYQSSEIVQWDLSQAHDINAVRNSETIVLVNSAYYWPFWNDNISSFMGDIAQAKDGKLYILSNTLYDKLVNQYPTPLFPTVVVPEAQTMHVIHQPNNLGLACQPERDAHYLDGNYINRAGYYLPHPIYPVPNPNVDTVLAGVKNVTQCFGQPVSLNLPLEATCIIWNTGSDSVMHSVQDTGWYWAKYNLDCSIHLDSFYVTNVPLPNIPEYIIACPEQAILDIEVAPHNIHQYQYDLVHTNRNDPRKVQTDSNWTWYKLLPGQYTLRVQSGNCDTSIHISIDTFPRPIVVVSPSTDTITYGTTIDLTASGAYLYNWFPTISLDTGIGSVVRATPKQTTTYEVIGINEYGCRDTTYTEIRIDHSMEFFIPNAFSPNGDGLNDEFRLEGLTFQRLTEWGIFNRFGEQVFFTTNIQDGWDGTYRGQPCNAGVYYYYLQFFRTDGRLEERRGEVHLVR